MPGSNARMRYNASVSDRNYCLNNVTIRVSRDGSRWKYQLLDFFKYEAERMGGFKTNIEARKAASAARHAYTVRVLKVAIKVDASKTISHNNGRRKRGTSPDPVASGNPLSNRLPPGTPSR